MNTLHSANISQESLLRLSLSIAKEAIGMIQRAGFDHEKIQIVCKNDGSPYTQFDIQVEKFVRNAFLKEYSEMNFCGEELGGVLDDRLTCVIDPIDGTNSFISHAHSHSFVLSLHENGKILIAIVANPSTGEIFFTEGTCQTKLLQLPFGNHQELERTLPIKGEEDNGDILLNIQNSKKGEIDSILLNTVDSHIRLKRIVSGSGALHIAEASKGFFTYVCDYRGSPATPYDLMSSVKILENAGGYVQDIDNKVVGRVGYEGVFVAGISIESVKRVISILKDH